MKYLFLIPARGGSKGIPGKNIKPLSGKPLISYSVEVAKSLTGSDNICVSTDDKNIVGVVEQMGVMVPFIRPADLSTDTAGSFEVIKHALSFYEEKGVNYDAVVLLQPTSPFRTRLDVEACLKLFSGKVDMVVSVCASKANPYFNLFEENTNGYLERSKPSVFVRRQEAPGVYEFNGAVYIISTGALKKYASLVEFPRIVKYEMDEMHSVDLDTERDWEFCEFLLEKKYLTI